MAVTVFRMTQISMTMVEGKIVKWLKQEGEQVTEDEPLLETETDKVTVEISAPATGVLRKILVGEGDYAQVGSPICLIADANEDISAYLDGAPADTQAATVQDAEVSESSPEKTPTKLKISPLARNLAKKYGVDASRLSGSGPDGLIVKADIEAANAAEKAVAIKLADPVAAIESEVEVEMVPLRGIRKSIADHLSLSKKTAADVTTVMDVDMTKIAAYRKVLPVSYTSFVVRAAAKALQDYPMLNSSLVGENIHIKKQINVCVAVATDAGLMTPVIRDTDKKNVVTIAEEMDVLANKGRDGQLAPADFADGTFTVTNSGTFGSLLFTPIINYPQCAILGMGKVAKTPIVRGDEIIAAPLMYLCLTYDHRIVDGAPAVKFLKQIKTYLENPEQIVMNKPK